jgi:UDP-2-acetamido-2,6-beta-L-arabino-hexul-4-ose reductase
MQRIGITGQNGFVGKHLFNTLGLDDGFELVVFENSFFENEETLDDFVKKCDVIVHLAALNRHENPQIIYDTNINLVLSLIASLKRTAIQCHVIMSSSTQEDNNNLYGQSKKEGRQLFEDWANESEGSFTGLIIPNVFGPFGKPFYNSVVATFCHLVANFQEPKIDTDSELKLIYVGELVKDIIEVIKDNTTITQSKSISPTYQIKVSEILNLLKTYQTQYINNGEIPALNNTFELNLFNTLRCYMNLESTFPVKFKKNVDERGAFVEIIRLGIGGQVSFSTTVPGITRGNHFHTRKIERFAVIKGKALIQLRQIGTDKVLNFKLDGNEPAYVDMPVWYTHNIKNIGEEDLYTNFWINEMYDPTDPDTYFENV